MKFYQYTRSLCRKMVQIRRNFVTTCTIRSTRGAKLPVDATFSGRSMVEMLGVLAIIGVLSVGAISGYSKAMMKYKLNKQTEQIGSILDYAFIHKDLLAGAGDGNFSAAPIMIKLGVIPQEMIRKNETVYIYDVFGNKTYLYRNQEMSGAHYYGLGIYINRSSHEICMNLFQIAKLRSADIWQTAFRKDQENGSDYQGSRIMGDKFCTTGKTCLKDLTMQKMEELCSFCDDSVSFCYFNILWDYQ